MMQPQGAAHLFEHVGGHGVGTEAAQDALAEQREEVSDADRVVHVGLRVMHDHGVGRN